MNFVVQVTRRSNGGMYVAVHEGDVEGPVIHTDLMLAPTHREAALRSLRRAGFNLVEVTGITDEDQGGRVWASGMARRIG